ncbi:transposase [Streptomyces sp. NPDC059193]|uniref:helix-turn-helix domain-containing protein n=1 Tax=Streptomyces sp. NPDC059193 TaxID=3346763 RepID=UPI0036A97354
MTVTVKDPKVGVLAASRSLNPHPEKVTDEVFLSSPFCDARDVVQVKYEMVRRVRVDGMPVAWAARAFGYCRQTFYEIAAALDAGGPGALAPGKPGPKGPVKLTAPVMDRIDAWRATDPMLTSKDLAAKVAGEFGFTVHPRSVERALARRREAESPGEDGPISRSRRRPEA